MWVMVPAGEPTRSVIDALRGLLEEGDLVIEGGNSRFSDDELHAAAFEAALESVFWTAVCRVVCGGGQKATG